MSLPGTDARRPEKRLKRSPFRVSRTSTISLWFRAGLACACGELKPCSLVPRRNSVITAIAMCRARPSVAYGVSDRATRSETTVPREITQPPRASMTQAQPPRRKQGSPYDGDPCLTCCGSDAASPLSRRGQAQPFPSPQTSASRRMSAACHRPHP